jgi:hypothetical protein
MSRSLWRCRNPDCSEPHGNVLGRVTTGGGLVLESSVDFVVYLDTGRITIRCPKCSGSRDFHGRFIRSSPGAANV